MNCWNQFIITQRYFLGNFDSQNILNLLIFCANIIFLDGNGFDKIKRKCNTINFMFNCNIYSECWNIVITKVPLRIAHAV